MRSERRVDGDRELDRWEPNRAPRRPFPMRRLVPAGAVLVSLVALLSGGGCGEGPTADPGRGAAGEWRRAAAPPLSARYAPLLAWTGSEVLVLGGHTGPACPPGADCAQLDDTASDGAAYDPEVDRWRPLPDPPVQLDELVGHVIVDGRLVVAEGDAWWSYETGANAWTRLPDPPRAGGAPEATDGRRIYTHRQGRVQVLDMATASWSQLPADPLRPRLRDGGVFATTAGIVMTGVAYGEAAPDEPTLAQADLWDGAAWRRLPRTGMIGPLLHWTGRHLVGAEIGGADGGEVNGWDRWYPAAGALDPSTGEWSQLPDVPGYDDLDARAWRIEDTAGPLLATAGFVYDHDRGTWTALGRPRSSIEQNTTGVWAGDRLVVVGGTDRDLEPVSEAWAWSP